MGDRIEVTLEVASNDNDRAMWARVVRADGSLCSPLNNLLLEELDAGKLVPRPIKVGDTVRFSSTWWVDRPAVVVAVDGNRAWIRADTGANAVPLLSDLVRVSP